MNNPNGITQVEDTVIEYEGGFRRVYKNFVIDEGVTVTLGAGDMLVIPDGEHSDNRLARSTGPADYEALLRDEPLDEPDDNSFTSYTLTIDGTLISKNGDVYNGGEVTLNGSIIVAQGNTELWDLQRRFDIWRGRGWDETMFGGSEYPWVLYSGFYFLTDTSVIAEYGADGATIDKVHFAGSNAPDKDSFSRQFDNCGVLIKDGDFTISAFGSEGATYFAAEEGSQIIWRRKLEIREILAVGGDFEINGDVVCNGRIEVGEKASLLVPNGSALTIGEEDYAFGGINILSGADVNIGGELLVNDTAILSAVSSAVPMPFTLVEGGRLRAPDKPDVTVPGDYGWDGVDLRWSQDTCTLTLSFQGAVISLMTGVDEAEEFYNSFEITVLRNAVFMHVSPRNWRFVDESLAMNFNGWSLDVEGTVAVEFDMVIAGDTVIYAGFVNSGSAPGDLVPVPGVPSAWAVDEVDEAIAAGIVPVSILQAGWLNATSRLAAAEAIAAVIEKAVGSTMEVIAGERGWDLFDNMFSDTSSLAVNFLKCAGVTDGVGDNMYAPDSAYTRAQVVTMIGRAAEAFFGVDATGGNPFSDVPDWAAPFVGYAAEAGITLGVTDVLFDSNGVLQNQHTAIFCLRALAAWVS